MKQLWWAATLGWVFSCGEQQARESGPENGVSDGDVSLQQLLVSCPAVTTYQPNSVSLPDHEEYRIAFTPDGKTAFFARGAGFFPETRQASIYMTQKQTGGGWSRPVVAPFSGVHSDLDPFVSYDGRRVYFSSIRPVAGELRSDLDIWYVERSGLGWGAPVNLGPRVNSRGDELYASVTLSGDVYFASDREGGFGAFDVWRTRAATANDNEAIGIENLGSAVNTEYLDINPWISPNGSLLIFSSLWRPGGYGYGDLYASVRSGAGFASAFNLGTCVNSAADEYHPAFFPWLSTFYFVRHEYEPSWIPGEIMRVSAKLRY